MTSRCRWGMSRTLSNEQFCCSRWVGLERLRELASLAVQITAATLKGCGKAGMHPLAREVWQQISAPHPSCSCCASVKLTQNVHGLVDTSVHGFWATWWCKVETCECVDHLHLCATFGRCRRWYARDEGSRVKRMSLPAGFFQESLCHGRGSLTYRSAHGSRDHHQSIGSLTHGDINLRAWRICLQVAASTRPHN